MINNDMEVKELIKPAVCVSEDATFSEALKAMINGQTNTLLVIDEEGCLVGEVSVADLLDAIVPEYMDGDVIATKFADEAMFEQAVRDAEMRLVNEFMSADFNSLELEDNLMAVATTAIANKRARIPVVDADNRPIGIISRQGLKHIIANYLGI